MFHSPTALVTGGSRGIGRGICIALSKKGYSLAINYSGNRLAAEETLETLDRSGSHFILQGDVSNRDNRESMVSKMMDRWGRIDVLVNNAGITSVGRKDVLEATEESWEQVLGVNLKGPYFLTQRVAQEMIRLRTSLIRPSIVNISSLSAITASVNRGDYCISKAGLSMMTQLYAIRLAEFGIHVFEVRPGIIDTDMTSGARDQYQRRIAEGLTPIRRLGTPQDVGDAVAMLVGSDFSFSTGDVWNVDGGFHLRRL